MTGDSQKAGQIQAARPTGELPPGLHHAVELPRLDDARLNRAMGWWQGLQDAPDRIPDRIRLDPTAIPDLLPWAILWDVLPAPDEDDLPADRLLYRCRLAGTMLNDFYGREARGQWLHEQFGDESAAMQAEYDAVVRLRRPLWAEHRMSWADKPYYRYRRLMLPFTQRPAAGGSNSAALHGDAERVALIFNVISFIGA